MAGWKNKTVLITGAGSGIGLAMVKKALQEGANVAAVVRRDNEALDALSTSSLLVIKGDVTKREDVQNFAHKISSKFHHLDIVINNAGAMFYMNITQPDYEQMRTMIETNCIGFINLIQEILPLLLKNKQSHWINITSDAGKRPFPGLAVYSGTKAFVEFCANAMRQELMNHEVKVTNIQPGNVQTPLHTKSTQTDAVSQYGTLNKGQYLSTNDIVNAVDYALSVSFQVAVNEILIEPFSESI